MIGFMTFSEKMMAKAKSMGKSIVLPESTEPRILKAAAIVAKEKIAKSVILIGNREKISQACGDIDVSIDDMIVIDPVQSDEIESYADEYFELRKNKGISRDEARSKIIDPLLWAAMMLRKGDVDAMVAGAENATAKVLVASFTIVKTAPGVKSASSCFVMEFPQKQWGKDGLMIFSDCATIPQPSVQQLAEITRASASSCRSFLQCEPIVAMLSFSTKGSASHPLADKVIQALEEVRKNAPEINVDGEMQLDAAIDPLVGRKKAPGSAVAGRANTLIFPDLQSGNIGYKIAQRFGGAHAFGPFLQGFAKPVSDLSRGSSVHDIVNTCAVTLTQAEQV